MRKALLVTTAVVGLGLLGFTLPQASAANPNTTVNANLTNVPAAGATGGSAANANSGTQGSNNSSTTSLSKDNGNSATLSKGNGNTHTNTLTVTKDSGNTTNVSKDNGNTHTTTITKDNGNSKQIGLAVALGLGDNVVGNGTLSSSVTKVSSFTSTDMTFATANASGNVSGGSLTRGSDQAVNTVSGNIGVITSNANSGIGAFTTAVAATGVNNGISWGK